MAYDQFPARDVQGGDAGILAEFFLDAVHMSFKSEQEGRPIFEDREFIRILVAGDRRSEVVREAREDDKRRFSAQYAAFKQGVQEHAQSGTPLTAWPAMTPSTIRQFNANNVFTVEQLANLSDTQMQNAGLGGREWAVKAQAYLAHAQDTSTATRLAAEAEAKDRVIADLQRQITELASHLTSRADDDEHEEVRRGPGRPRKAA